MSGIISKDETKALKGMAIIAVILTHANGAQVFCGIPIFENTIITSMLCQIGMCTFLLLSGYGLYCTVNVNGFLGWWDKRISKVFLPAIFVNGIWYIVTSISDVLKYKSFSISVGTLVGDVLCVNEKNTIDSSMWYLSYLLLCYILFWICFCYIPQKYSIIVFLFLWCVNIPVSKALWGSAFYCLLSFGLGVLWGHFASKNTFHMNLILKNVWILASIVLAIFYYFIFRYNWLIDNLISNFLAFGCVLLFNLIDCKKLKLVCFIGECSFALYLLEGKTICKFPFDRFVLGVRLVLFVALLLFSIFIAWTLNLVIKNLEKLRVNNIHDAME